MPALDKSEVLKIGNQIAGLFNKLAESYEPQPADEEGPASGDDQIYDVCCELREFAASFFTGLEADFEGNGDMKSACFSDAIGKLEDAAKALAVAFVEDGAAPTAEPDFTEAEADEAFEMNDEEHPAVKAALAELAEIDATPAA